MSDQRHTPDENELKLPHANWTNALEYQSEKKLFSNLVFAFDPWTLRMLGLLLPNAQECKDFCQPSKSCHVGIHWIALSEYSPMSTHVPGF